MRLLTIHRRKSFTGSLVKQQVYIEDPLSGDLKIQGVLCRKLGTLKNGEQTSFQVDDFSARLFVFADKLSREFCCEVYPLPAGTEDIYLEGQCKFDLSRLHAFCFDDSTAPVTRENRKKTRKWSILVLVAAMLVGVAAGYVITTATLAGQEDAYDVPKRFTCENLSITLTQDFKEATIQGYTGAYDSSKVAVLLLREGFALMEGLEDYTLSQYAELVLQANAARNPSRLKTAQGLTYFTYDFTNPDTNQTFAYSVFLYKSGDAFWMVQFAVLEDAAQELEPFVLEWAGSVAFSKGANT